MNIVYLTIEYDMKERTIDVFASTSSDEKGHILSEYKFVGMPGKRWIHFERDGFQHLDLTENEAKRRDIGGALYDILQPPQYSDPSPNQTEIRVRWVIINHDNPAPSHVKDMLGTHSEDSSM